MTVEIKENPIGNVSMIIWGNELDLYHGGTHQVFLVLMARCFISALTILENIGKAADLESKNQKAYF